MYGGPIPGVNEIYVNNICVKEVSCSTYSLNNSNVGMITVNYTDCTNSPATVDVYDSNIEICAKPGTVVPQIGLVITQVTTLCQPKSKIYITNNSSNVTVVDAFVNYPTSLPLDLPDTYPIGPLSSAIATYINGTYGFRLLISNSDTLTPAKITLVDSTGTVSCQDAGFSGNMVFFPVVLQDSYPGNYDFTVVVENGSC
jgi:hypothetical protein